MAGRKRHLGRRGQGRRTGWRNGRDRPKNPSRATGGFGTGDLAVDGNHVERTYLAAKGRVRISALYMVEEGPDSLKDLVLHESGWVRTSTICDWRFGERSDINEVTREEARRFAEGLGLGKFVN